MSTRASLFTKSEDLAESVGWIPLLWTPLMSSSDLARSLADDTCVEVNRREAIERYDRATPFLATLFPDYDLANIAEDFHARLQRLRAKTITIEFNDHIAIRPEIFLSCLAVAVAAIESQNAKAKFVCPAITGTNPFTGEGLKSSARTLRTTRDVLCCALSLEPVIDDSDLMHDQLVGG